MPNFEKMYYTLFNHITDASEALQKGNIAAALETLKNAQLEAEEMYMEEDEKQLPAG